jgi:hypothetical protein
MKPKMSAQALSNRCADLGWPIERTVISNLESGYRKTVALPELFVLAEALGVPPIMLMLPLGQAEEIEILPGRTVSTMEALRWVLGEAPLPGSEWGDLAQSTVASLQVHQKNVDQWTWARYYAARIRSGEHEGTEQDVAEHEARAERAVDGLRSLRSLMRARQLQPPQLPRELAGIVDGAAGSAGS